jgi:hypothetical protein
MKRHLGIFFAALALSASSAAYAQVIDLTFEGIGNDNPIGNYYDGGAGPNYGISFSSNALAIGLNTLTSDPSDTSRGGLGDPNSQLGGLYFLSGGSTFMDDPAGFTTGFSLNYTAINDSGSLDVYSGVDGTGTLLATLNLPTTPSNPNGICDGYSALFCPFYPVGVTFSGTAESIVFSGVENQIVFDDVTFGSSTPGMSATPEPSSLVLLFTGAGAIATEVRRRMKRA